MKISYTTELRRNNRKDYFKPNEDYLIINNNTFIIADGVSRDRVKVNTPYQVLQPMWLKYYVIQLRIVGVIFHKVRI